MYVNWEAMASAGASYSIDKRNLMSWSMPYLCVTVGCVR